MHEATHALGERASMVGELESAARERGRCRDGCKGARYKRFLLLRREVRFPRLGDIAVFEAKRPDAMLRAVAVERTVAHACALKL